MQIKKTKLTVKKALSLDLDFGLEWLDSWILKNTDAYNEVLLHRSNFQTIENDLRKQLLDPLTANRKIAKTRYALMLWIDQVDEEDLDHRFDHSNFLEQLHRKEKKLKFRSKQEVLYYSKWIISFFLIFLLGLSIWWGYSDKEVNGGYSIDTFDLKIAVYGDSAKSAIITNGTLRVLLNGKPEFLPIGEDGRVIWSNLPNSARNANVYANPQVDDYQMEQLTLQIPAIGNVLDIILNPVRYQTMLRGNVIYKKRPGKNLLVDIQGIETITDQKGDFEQLVPYKKGTEVRIRVFKDNLEIYNGTEIISDHIITIP